MQPLLRSPREGFSPNSEATSLLVTDTPHWFSALCHMALPQAPRPRLEHRGERIRDTVRNGETLVRMGGWGHRGGGGGGRQEWAGGGEQGARQIVAKHIDPFLPGPACYNAHSRHGQRAEETCATIEKRSEMTAFGTSATRSRAR